VLPWDNLTGSATRTAVGGGGARRYDDAL